MHRFGFGFVLWLLGAASSPATTPTEAASALALKAPASARFSSADTPAAWGNDGDLSTVWRAGPEATEFASWELQLPAPQTVQSIVLQLPEKAAYRYALEVSTEDGAPRLILNQADNQRLIDRLIVVGDFGRFDTFRVNFAATGYDPRPALSEVNLHGAGPDPLPAGRLRAVVFSDPELAPSSGPHGLEAAFDGNFATYTELSTNGWLGLDLGQGRSTQIAALAFAPGPRVAGGRLEGAQNRDFSDARELVVLPAELPAGQLTQLKITKTIRVRYLRYLPPSDAPGQIAELVLLGQP